MRLLASRSLAAALLLATPLAAQRVGEPLQLRSEDNFRIEAIHYPPTEAREGRQPAILLLPGGGQPKEVWQNHNMLGLFGNDHAHLLTLNVRGQGESQERPPTMSPGLGVLDVEAALEWLMARDDVDSTRIAIVGASYGANLAQAGVRVRGWNVVGIVTLSHTMAGFRWFPEDEYRHPIPSGFFLHASDEPERYQTAEALERLVAATAGDAATMTVKGRTHAQGLYNFRDVEGMVRSWLTSALR